MLVIRLTWISWWLFCVLFLSVLPEPKNTCPHAWQKHVLPANQTPKFWQSNFKVYPPTLEHFGTTPPGKAKSIRNSLGHFVFGVLKIRMNETPVFHLDAYSALHRKTLTITFCYSEVQTVWFLSWHFLLILQHWPVFHQARKLRLLSWQSQKIMFKTGLL